MDGIKKIKKLKGGVKGNQHLQGREITVNQGIVGIKRKLITSGPSHQQQQSTTKCTATHRVTSGWEKENDKWTLFFFFYI